MRRKAAEMNMNTILLKPKDIFDELEIELYLNGNSANIIKSGKKNIVSEDLTAVFPRFYMLTGRNHYYGKFDIYTYNEWDSFYKGWLQTFNVAVINSIVPSFWNKTKLFASDLFTFLQSTNLKLPSFISSNNCKDLKEFFLSNTKNVIYIPCTQPSLIYIINSDDKFSGLEKLSRVMIIMLYQYVIGDCYKVYTAGSKTFASDAKGNKTVSVPAGVLKDCYGLSSKLNLTFVEFEICKNKQDWYLLSIDLFPKLICSKDLKEEIIHELLNLI